MHKIEIRITILGAISKNLKDNLSFKFHLDFSSGKLTLFIHFHLFKFNELLFFIHKTKLILIVYLIHRHIKI